MRSYIAGTRTRKGAVTALGIGLLVAGPLISFFTGVSDDKSHLRGCRFPAMFNFGDSNSDTGGRTALDYQLPSPYGITFPGKPHGRLSDGKVMIDVFAEKLGLPYLSAYLDSMGANFGGGANFATAGSTIQPLDGTSFEAKFSPISLDVQLFQFMRLKAHADEVYSQGKLKSAMKDKLPRPEEFSKALYTFDIGQNDFFAGLMKMTPQQLTETLPNITLRLSMAVEKLYEEGARFFWMHNTGPIGCLPYALLYSLASSSIADNNGCLESHNELAREFNLQLKTRVIQLRTQLSDAVLIYVDVYAAKYTLISNAEKFGNLIRFAGFKDPLGYCCGSDKVQCGNKEEEGLKGGEGGGAVCRNSSEYISWDGAHYSEAANKWVADRIADGSFSDPRISLEKLCRRGQET